jgi:hypothetical protein
VRSALVFRTGAKSRAARVYPLAEIGLSAFSLFVMGSQSFVPPRRALVERHGRSNCQTLFGMSAIPTEAYIRVMLDGVLTPFRRLGGKVLIALDGTEHFCPRKIHCQRCSIRKRLDGGTEYFHTFLGATIVASGHQQVLPLPPEFIVLQDRAEKQDCERNAAKRWLEQHGPTLAGHPSVFLGDDLFACQPIAEYVRGTELEEHRRFTVARGKSTATIYRWLSAVPSRAADDAMTVNWFSIEIREGKSKRTYHNSFIAGLPAATVAELAACGRALWKIENETFNVLKTGKYNLEHNFGHGQETLASLLVVLNLLAFAFHTTARMVVLA